jgi:hypothetical protein
MDDKGPTADEGKRQKKPYLAPSVEKVPLRPEEAVLGFCKNDNVAGPRGAKCRPAVCSSQGS